MAKSGDYVVLPFGQIVAVLETGNVTVLIPTHQTGRPTADSQIVEFDQRFVQFVKGGGIPANPIAIPPGSAGSPENPIVIPGTPSHPIASPTPPSGAHPDQGLPSGGARPDNTLPAGGAHPDQGLPAGGARPDNTLPGTPSTKPTPVPPAGTKPVPPAEPKK